MSHRWLTLLPGLLLAAPAALSMPQAGSKAEGNAVRVHLQPKLVPGDVIRYRVQFQTTNQTTRSGAITDPQGPGREAVTWDAVLRLEVLDGSAPNSTASSSPGKGAIRLRTTYEKSSATLKSDLPDPEQQNIEKQYAQMQGKSMEFTLAADGHISNVQGLEDVVSDRDAVKAAQQWMAQFSSSAAGPAGGIAIGDTWSAEEPASLPLANHAWRTESTYLRNEACPSENLASNPALSSGGMCAVIRAQLTLTGPKAQKDATPEEYKRNGLETSGTWSGAGESLSYVALDTGWLVSVTQEMSEQMDVTISNGPHVSVHYAGAVTSRSSMSPAAPDPGN